MNRSFIGYVNHPYFLHITPDLLKTSLSIIFYIQALNTFYLYYEFTNYKSQYLYDFANEVKT